MAHANPDIKTVLVGVRELHKVFIYPLSMNDQFQLLEKLSTAIQKIAEGKQLDLKSNIEGIAFMKDVISENLEQVLEYVTDKEERPELKEITNNQLFEIVNIIFSVNFESMIKNFKDLFQRAKGITEGMQVPQDSQITAS